MTGQDLTSRFATNTPGVSDDSKRRILWDNALALYGIDQPAEVG